MEGSSQEEGGTWGGRGHNQGTPGTPPRSWKGRRGPPLGIRRARGSATPQFWSPGLPSRDGRGPRVHAPGFVTDAAGHTQKMVGASRWTSGCRVPAAGPWSGDTAVDIVPVTLFINSLMARPCLTQNKPNGRAGAVGRGRRSPGHLCLPPTPLGPPWGLWFAGSSDLGFRDASAAANTKELSRPVSAGPRAQRMKSQHRGSGTQGLPARPRLRW